MANIIITADIHFGVQDKLSYAEWAMSSMNQYAIDNDINKIIITASTARRSNIRCDRSASVFVACAVNAKLENTIAVSNWRILGFMGFIYLLLL